MITREQLDKEMRTLVRDAYLDLGYKHTLIFHDDGRFSSRVSSPNDQHSHFDGEGEDHIDLFDECFTEDIADDEYHRIDIYDETGWGFFVLWSDIDAAGIDHDDMRGMNPDEVMEVCRASDIELIGEEELLDDWLDRKWDEEGWLDDAWRKVEEFSRHKEVE